LTNEAVYINGVFCGIKHSGGTEWVPYMMAYFATTPMLMRLALRKWMATIHKPNKHTPRHTRHGNRKREHNGTTRI